jgi:hypothetical protein
MRVRIIDQITQGATENAELSRKSKRALYGAGAIVLLGALGALIIRKNG